MKQVLDDIGPVKTVRISAKWRYIEPRMTRGLEEASKTKLKLYKKCIQIGSTTEDQCKYKQHRNIYKELKQIQKKDYYQTKCQAYKSNSKKLWALINNTITKVKHKGSIIPYITVDGIRQNRPKGIANSFGEFYSKLGSSLAEKVVPGTTSINDYLAKIPKQVDSIALKQTMPLETDTIIRNLPNKTSHGHDEISNIMLKAL